MLQQSQQDCIIPVLCYPIAQSNAGEVVVMVFWEMDQPMIKVLRCMLLDLVGEFRTATRSDLNHSTSTHYHFTKIPQKHIRLVRWEIASAADLQS